MRTKMEDEMESEVIQGLMGIVPNVLVLGSLHNYGSWYRVPPFPSLCPLQSLRKYCVVVRMLSQIRVRFLHSYILGRIGATRIPGHAFFGGCNYKGYGFSDIQEIAVTVVLVE